MDVFELAFILSGLKKKVSGVQKGAGQSKGCTLVINIMYNFMNLKINIYN